ncbi:hypothetical protein GYMLUDRAFT_59257 [Collybiopsis luxurians FD-317 M1]|uniref:CxC2-like cysteine cluster KDZ transposase-associated domain-containing protein n=1 Tax=Collybiopsis luxurians FD-317 M1 TaxID=944289 RepID=A0A0D0CEB2_9AGAR|nr:hypothetical protein GYMLUDRAFT_59257 [Collybiopsis luxurians FD-317 M1]
MDISILKNSSYNIHLCSDGSSCAYCGNPHLMTVVHTNGIHGTRVSYCFHDREPDAIEQLMRAHLFLMILKDPGTVVTFHALDDFHKHNLVSKKAAYDYVGTLCHLTDGCFTAKIPDPNAKFLMAACIWRQLCLEKWTGQAYNLTAEFPHRTPNSLITFCPACPEDSFNMEPNWEKTPSLYRHMNQVLYGLDGNFHTGQYTKNMDPDDITLETVNGIGYFPDQVEVEQYLNKTPEVQEVRLLTTPFFNTLS